MLACLVGHADASKHARDFLHAFVRAEHREHRSRGLAVGQLRHAHVRVSLARYLRKMRHAQHLRALAERAQLTSDDFRDTATDAGVDFVEHQTRQRVRLCGGNLDREADARQLAA